jgi:hypothetical protein
MHLVYHQGWAPSSPAETNLPGKYQTWPVMPHSNTPPPKPPPPQISSAAGKSYEQWPQPKPSV